MKSNRVPVFRAKVVLLTLLLAAGIGGVLGTLAPPVQASGGCCALKGEDCSVTTPEFCNGGGECDSNTCCFGVSCG